MLSGVSMEDQSWFAGLLNLPLGMDVADTCLRHWDEETCVTVS